VPSEMLSGPDLGGGFLHQLTLDRDGDRTTFTFHAQDGGSDAGGPPAGPPDVFGYSHPPNPCQFGGPHCWHRRFLLSFEEIPKVRRAYNRCRFVLETMIAQAHLGAPIGLEIALTELVRRLPAPAVSAAPEWYIGGSTAAWLLGADLKPRDIDLGTTRPGVDRLADLLGEFLIEPVATTDWPLGRIVYGARAFVGTFREGARVEWAVSLEPVRSPVEGEWEPSLGGVRCLTVDFHGSPVRVTRPEYSLVKAAQRGPSERLDVLARLVRRLRPDSELLEGLLAHPTIPAGTRETVERILGRATGPG
jgi:hypothetical protein